MTMILGLTGSIGAGKTTTARLFAKAGASTWSADDAVARLYEPGGGGEEALGELCPQAVPRAGEGVDKRLLKFHIDKDPSLLGRLEEVVHPLVKRDREVFIDRACREGRELLVLEIPLLFETGAESEVDAVVVVTAPEYVRRQRVLSRGSMTEQQLAAVSERQMPDEEKRRRADFVIETGTMEQAAAEVERVMKQIREPDGG